jgi:hypothetical protein
MRDRLYINVLYRDQIDVWKEKKVLGIEMLENKDIFLLAVALGMGSAAEIQGKRDGFIRTSYIKSRDKSLLASLLLGKLESQEDIDKYANDDLAYEEAEKCAEAGFAILKDMIESASFDEELIEKRVLAQLNLLYEQYVVAGV